MAQLWLPSVVQIDGHALSDHQRSGQILDISRDGDGAAGDDILQRLTQLSSCGDADGLFTGLNIFFVLRLVWVHRSLRGGDFGRGHSLGLLRRRCDDRLKDLRPTKPAEGIARARGT